MIVKQRRQPIPGPTSGVCPQCGRRLPAYGGQCLCGWLIPTDTTTGVWLDQVAERQPGTFRLAHLSDLHVGALGPHGLSARDRLYMILEAVRDVGTDHLLVTGDVSRVGLPEEMHAAEATLTAGGFPPSKRTVIPGNHDLQESMDLSIYEAHFTERTPCVKKLSEGVWLGAVDSNAVARQQRSLIFERLIAPVQGQVGDKSLAAIYEELSTKEGVKLLALHHHLARHAPEDLNSRWDVAWGTKVGKVLLDPVIDAAAVLNLARELGISAIYHGHKHWYGKTGYRVGGVPVFNAGSTTLMERPRFRTFDFLGNQWVAIHEVQLTL